MEFSALAARVHVRRKRREQIAVVHPTRERFGELPRIDAGQHRPQAGIEHAPGERGRFARGAPQGEERLEPRPAQALLAVGADVFEEEIPEGDVGHAFGPRSTEGRGHQRLVVRVRAGPRQQDRPQRETRRRCLRRDQLTTHRMHRHTIGGLVEGGEQPDELDIVLLAKLVQGPGAVLP
jgi:hypothetical protein